MTFEDIKEFRNDWEDQDLKDEIDRRILHPLEDFEKFLENEIDSLEVNSQFEAMRVRIILAEFREKFA